MENIIISEDIINTAVWGLLFLIGFVNLIRAIKLVPTRSAYVVERLGKYHCTLEAGFHILFPFIDRVAHIHDLKEETIDVPPQDCFSKDEVKVEVDGVIYISVTDPVKATYGITDYRFAAMQLAQTTTRSVIGTLDLDKTFEERELISSKVVAVLDEAGHKWGIKVHRYEIKNIQPPNTVKQAMEMQVNAERNRRARLAESEGDRQSRINRSEGQRREMINLSNGEKEKRINEAQGKAQEILTIARATADSIKMIGAQLNAEGGDRALKMQLGKQYIGNISGLIDEETKIIIPSNLVDYEQWMGSVGLSSKD
jgi:regulator of protease activity HflC (stomatin/prohibitin superfamily)